MIASLWIALGGALGSVSRYWIGIWLLPLSRSFPVSTIFINGLGSFVIGFFAALTLAQSRFPMSENIRLFVMIGLCGGFTTFSSFSLQNFDLLRDAAFFRAFMNICISVFLCLMMTALGFYLAQRLNLTQTSHHIG